MNIYAKEITQIVHFVDNKKILTSRQSTRAQLFEPAKSSFAESCYHCIPLLLRENSSFVDIWFNHLVSLFLQREFYDAALCVSRRMQFQELSDFFVGFAHHRAIITRRETELSKQNRWLNGILEFNGRNMHEFENRKKVDVLSCEDSEMWGI